MNQVIAEINMPIAKAATAITAAVGANTNTAETVAIQVAANLMQNSGDPWWFWFIVSVPWGPIASFLAAIYTAMIAGEWLWKKAFRPMAVRLGWAAPRRPMTASDWAALAERAEQ